METKGNNHKVVSFFYFLFFAVAGAGAGACDRSCSGKMAGKKRISYFYDSEVGNYHFGYGHPMKPHRVRMAHELIVNYGLYQKLMVTDLPVQVIVGSIMDSHTLKIAPIIDIDDAGVVQKQLRVTIVNV